MKLSKRLKAICDLIPENSDVIDIGTDHGYVPIYLTKIKKCKCTATDISEKSLLKAKNNAEKAKTKIEFICTDGLNNLKLKDEIIIISGMGTKTILKILNKNINNDLVISTNNDIEALIDYLAFLNYQLKCQLKVIEHKKYEVIYFTKNNRL